MFNRSIFRLLMYRRTYRRRYRRRQFRGRARTSYRRKRVTRARRVVRSRARYNNVAWKCTYYVAPIDICSDNGDFVPFYTGTGDWGAGFGYRASLYDEYRVRAVAFTIAPDYQGGFNKNSVAGEEVPGVPIVWARYGSNNQPGLRPFGVQNAHRHPLVKTKRFYFKPTVQTWFQQQQDPTTIDPIFRYEPSFWMPTTQHPTFHGLSLAFNMLPAELLLKVTMTAEVYIEFRRGKD